MNFSIILILFRIRLVALQTSNDKINPVKDHVIQYKSVAITVKERIISLYILYRKNSCHYFKHKVLQKWTKSKMVAGKSKTLSSSKRRYIGC